MIEYIIPNNIDERVLKKASNILKEGGLVCLPTDTNWVALACPFSKGGLDRLHSLKGEGKAKHYGLLCASFKMASEIAVISDSAFRMLKNNIPGHYTFIFEATKTLRKAIKASKMDREVGLRFCPSSLVNHLLEFHAGALASSHIIPSMLDVENVEDIYSLLIDEQLGHHIKLTIDPGEFTFGGESTIYSFVEEPPTLIRQGRGELLF